MSTSLAVNGFLVSSSMVRKVNNQLSWESLISLVNLHFQKKFQHGVPAFSGFTNGLVESQNNIKEDGAPGESDPTQPSVPVKSAGVKVKPTLATEGAQLESVRQDIPDHGTKAAHENAKNTGEVKPAQGCADDNPQAGIKLAMTSLQKQMAFLEEQQCIFLDPLAQKLGDIQGEVERQTRTSMHMSKTSWTRFVLSLSQKLPKKWQRYRSICRSMLWVIQR